MRKNELEIKRGEEKDIVIVRLNRTRMGLEDEVAK